MDELEALKAIDDAFSALDDGARGRTLQWLAAKYSIKAGIVGDGASSAANSASGQVGAISMTAKAVATTLDVKTGPNLLYAAAAYLAVVRGEDKLSRDSLLEAMKTATGFFKKSDSKNLTKYLDGLCKNGTLIEIAANTFAVKANALNEMKSKLLQ